MIVVVGLTCTMDTFLLKSNFSYVDYHIRSVKFELCAYYKNVPYSYLLSSADTCAN